MTDGTRYATDLKTAAQILTDEPCNCGAIPLIDYEAGSTQIKCPKGCASFTAPDFQIADALDGWRRITQ